MSALFPFPTLRCAQLAPLSTPEARISRSELCHIPGQFKRIKNARGISPLGLSLQRLAAFLVFRRSSSFSSGLSGSFSLRPHAMLATELTVLRRLIINLHPYSYYYKPIQSPLPQHTSLAVCRSSLGCRSGVKRALNFSALGNPVGLQAMQSVDGYANIIPYRHSPTI